MLSWYFQIVNNYTLMKLASRCPCAALALPLRLLRLYNRFRHSWRSRQPSVVLLLSRTRSKKPHGALITLISLVVDSGNIMWHVQWHRTRGLTLTAPWGTLGRPSIHSSQTRSWRPCCALITLSHFFRSQ